ncbi:hypothetical protein TetV_519 [Tetraselmis virus 1]|uniref:Uncharacterized protein n=1 Tax=Tetraselmis virus 1 TaxID=2060617 RepID=A0A2P0VNY3_9VIRU|nr:hypothetical protein QJ968_gp535 [Tetraselmis virus 1]AUF82601.1 hypothetical protein TetV_519 [Tetraselmis virus 1]
MIFSGFFSSYAHAIALNLKYDKEPNIVKVLL